MTIYLSQDDLRPLLGRCVDSKEGLKGIKLGGSIGEQSDIYIRSLIINGETYASLEDAGLEIADQAIIEGLAREIEVATGSPPKNDTLSMGAVAYALVSKGIEGLPRSTPSKSSWLHYVDLGIFGGRQEIYITRAQGRFEHIDRSSAYGRILRDEPIPYGGPIIIDGECEPSPLFYDLCVAEVEGRLDPGPLPYRQEDGSVCYPKGRWIGAYWRDELNLSEYPRIAKTLRFARTHCLRAQAEKALKAREISVYPKFWKGVLVRMVGLLGQRGPDRKIYLDRAVWGAGKQSKEIAVGDVEIAHDTGIIARYSKPYHRPWTNLTGASYVWSTCRVSLYREMERVRRAGDAVLTCHTDGMIVWRLSGYAPSVGWREKWILQDGVFTGKSAGWWMAYDRRTGEEHSAHSGSPNGWTEEIPMGINIPGVTRWSSRIYGPDQTTQPVVIGAH